MATQNPTVSTSVLTGKVAAIGTVKMVIGTVSATSPDGVVRVLQVGDKVNANDVIQTGDLASIDIEFVNGAHMDLGRNAQTVLDTDVFNPAVAQAAVADVAAIQALIAAGADPTAIAAATAAGAGAASEGGHTFVQVDPNYSPGNVTSGFETDVVTRTFLTTEGQVVGPITPTVSVTVAVGSGGLAEGNPGEEEPGGSTAVFNVTLSAPSATDTVVSYHTVNGTATTADSDYTSVSGTVTIPAGATSAQIQVPVTGDLKVEADETFTVVLDGTDNATITVNPAASSADWAIINDDVTTLSIGNASATEGSPLEFALSLSNPSYEAITFNLTAGTPGTATPGTDYETATFEYSTNGGTTWSAATGNNVTFAAGATDMLVRVDTAPDSTYEPDETMTLSASVVSGTATATDTGVGTITNDDAAPTLTIGDATATEGSPLEFALSLSNPSYEAITFNLTAGTPGTATPGTDYETATFEYSTNGGTTWSAATGNNVTFAAGATDMLVRVDTAPDSTYEPDETMTLSASVVSGTATATDTGVGTITNDDAAPTFSIDNWTVIEGVDSTITFTITKSGDTALSSTVQYSVYPGSATTPSDYTTPGPLSGTLTFAPGDTTQTVTLTIVNDTVMEPTETFTVVLSTPVNASIASGTGIGTILDDDLPAPNYLNGALITNSNQTVQQSILTFVQVNDPTHAYAKWISFDGQGQEGNLNQDVGFNIDSSQNYVVSLEAAQGGTKTLVTEFNLEGVTIDPHGGTFPIQVDGEESGKGGSVDTAFTAVITPDDPTTPLVFDKHGNVTGGNEGLLVQSQTASLDGNTSNNTLTDPSETQVNFLAGDAGIDTLNGGPGTETDILNGGAGADTLNGGGGNDILVYDPADTLISGGGGFDLLRLDGLPNGGAVIDLRNVSSLQGGTSIGTSGDIEGILITDDANSDPNPGAGTTVILTAQDVLDYSSGNTLYVLGNPGDTLNIGLTNGVNPDGWTTTGVPDLQGFITYTATINGATLLVEDTNQVLVV